MSLMVFDEAISWPFLEFAGAFTGFDWAALSLIGFESFEGEIGGGFSLNFLFAFASGYSI